MLAHLRRWSVPSRIQLDGSHAPARSLPVRWVCCNLAVPPTVLLGLVLYAALWVVLGTLASVRLIDFHGMCWAVGPLLSCLCAPQGLLQSCCVSCDVGTCLHVALWELLGTLGLCMVCGFRVVGPLLCCSCAPQLPMVAGLWVDCNHVHLVAVGLVTTLVHSPIEGCARLAWTP